MHAKYEVSTSNGSQIKAKVKVDDRQTNRQTGQKQYTPDHSIRGIKIKEDFCEHLNSQKLNFYMSSPDILWTKSNLHYQFRMLFHSR